LSDGVFTVITADGLRVAQSSNGAVTAFAWDWATPVPEVLSAGVTRYLLGAETLGQWDGAAWTYVLPDALGSVRQTVDRAGTVTAYREWSPYGAEVGGAQAGLGYTGEWQDADTGLVYLRARWYQAETGRFTQQDLVAFDFYVTQSLSRYSYVLNNTINLTDPSGRTPESQSPPNHYDLTYWLYNELNANSNSYYVQRISQLWHSIDGFDKSRALAAFYFLVKDRAKWDFKHSILNKLGNTIALYHWGAHWYEYSLPGNLHYGFVGRASGFEGVLLHTGAGIAEIIDPAHQSRGEACCPEICYSYWTNDWNNPTIYQICQRLGCYYINPDWIKSLFDDPTDWASTESGIQMYNTYGRYLTITQFKDYLAFPGNELVQVPAPTKDDKFDAAWPYPVGYFNGPDDKKNERWIQVLLSKW